MLEIYTDRLIIAPLSLNVAKSLVFHREELDSLSPIDFPNEWPGNELKSLLPFYIERVETCNDELGWGIWLFISTTEKKIIGNGGFKGKPIDGEVEIGYSIIESYRRKGLGYEGTQALVDWAFEQKGVTLVKAECVDSNIGSIRILEKSGFRCVKREGCFLKWELKKSKEKSGY